MIEFYDLSYPNTKYNHAAVFYFSNIHQLMMNKQKYFSILGFNSANNSTVITILLPPLPPASRLNPTLYLKGGCILISKRYFRGSGRSPHHPIPL
jgi:hypothetical protein